MDISWRPHEVWYKIIDRNTIAIVSKYGSHVGKNYNVIPLKFHATLEKPSSNGWIKQEKWFWANENEYLDYMAKYKRKNIRRK
jgi:hypothetical protein